MFTKNSLIIPALKKWWCERHTKFQARLAALLRFHPRVDWLQEISGDLTAAGLTAIIRVWDGAWKRSQILRQRWQAERLRVRIVTPCQVSLTAVRMRQLWSVLLGISFWIWIKSWIVHDYRIWFMPDILTLWTWNMTKSQQTRDTCEPITDALRLGVHEPNHTYVLNLSWVNLSCLANKYKKRSKYK